MKRKYFSKIFLVVVLMATAAIAYADTLPRSISATFVPKVSGANCTTIAPGKTSSATVPLNGSRQVTWQAFDSTGADVVVKRHLKTGTTTNTAYIKSAGKAEVADLAANAFVFKRFSTANNQITTNVCADLD